MAIQEQFYTIHQVSDIIPSLRVSIVDGMAKVDTLLYDSRRISNAATGLFFALSGRRDGHRYLADAYTAGVRSFVIAGGHIDYTVFPDANFIEVSDTLQALQTLAAYHRNRFTYPVIGITGSNGKTIVKEWLMQLLAPEYRIVRSPKSYNSQIGVALSLWQLDHTCNLAIIEAGISQPGEMAPLHRMIRPDIGVLTTIGPAHDDGFSSLDEKIKEKLQLFAGTSQAVYRPGSLRGIPVPSAGKHTTWGTGNEVLQVLGYEILAGNQCVIRVRCGGAEVEVVIPFTDAASRENALCCWAVMYSMGYGQPVIAQRMALLQPVEMRLEMKKGINRSTVIDDSYSNDLSSLAIALDFLRQQQQHPTRTLVLSDIPGARGHEEQVYAKLPGLLTDNKIDRVITVGPQLLDRAGMFAAFDHRGFVDTDTLLGSLPSLNFDNEAILLKGGRAFAFERISSALAAKRHDTVLEINLTAVEHNLNQYKSLLPSSVKLMAMVKAFSYGSGSFEVASLLQFSNVDYLAVAYVDEGVELRRSGIRLPIMVMSPNAASFEALLAYRLEPEIYSFEVLEDFISVLKTHGESGYPIHIKVDTGMHRLGFTVADATALSKRLQNENWVRVQSVFSHLAAAGEAVHDAFTLEQLTAFGEFAKTLTGVLGYPVLRHIANSAAIERWPQAHLDMVRLGIGLYGIGNDSSGRLGLQQTGTLKTVVTQVRKVPAGHTVGYGRRGRLGSDSTIATVNIGYADGYDRRFGNGVGYMLIGGKKAYTIGDICMDMTMLDVGEMDVRAGDEVIVFGDVTQLAARIGTIPYELLTGISGRVKRVYYYG